MNSITNQELNILKASKLYQGIDENLLLKSIEGSRLKKLQRKEFLYTAGGPIESFAIVLSGAIKLLRPTLNGENIIMHIAVTGELIGGLVMNQKNLETYPISAVGMIPSRVLCIPRATFVSVWKDEIHFQSKLNTLMYKRMSNLQDDKTFFSAPLKTRLVMLLTRYLDKSQNEISRALVLPLTRQEIADSLGVAVESVIRIISDWSHHGIIKTNDRMIEIINFEELVRAADI